MRQEGARRCTNLKGSENGRIYLKKALAVKERTKLAQNKAALHKGILNLGINDKIHIALAVTCFLILEAMEFLGQGQKALGKQHQFGTTHTDLAHLGAEHNALYTNDIADIHFLKAGIGLFTDHIAAHINLNIALIVTQMRKARLTHYAFCHHTACKAYNNLGFFLCGKISKARLDVSRISILRIFGNLKGIRARLAKCRQLFAAHAQDIA